MIRILAAAVGLSLAFASPAPAAETCAPRDRAAVTRAASAFFEALAGDDQARLRNIQAPAFYAFDVGVRFDGMALAELVKTEQGKGRVFRWKVTRPDVHLACDTAWIAYVNDGAIGDATGMTPIRWLESMALEYASGAWRIAFLHSTRMAPEPPPVP